MLIDRKYDPRSGPLVPVMVGSAHADAWQPLYIKSEALLSEQLDRTALGTRLARKVGLPIPMGVFEGEVDLNVLIRGDDGWVLFKDVKADVSMYPPTGHVTTDARMVLGRDVIGCGELVRYQPDGPDHPTRFLFSVDTGTGVLPLRRLAGMVGDDS